MIKDDLQDDLNHTCILGLKESLSIPCISSKASRHCSFSSTACREVIEKLEKINKQEESKWEREREGEGGRERVREREGEGEREWEKMRERERKDIISENEAVK